MKKPNLLIADSGSTKTDWVYIENGTTQNRFTTEGINPFFMSKDAISVLLETKVLPNLRSDNSNLAEIHFYGAGCANEVASAPITDSLKRLFSSTSIIAVSSDMLGAARGICGNKPGIACILGTGANNAVYNGAHITSSIGSLGFWLGDEGSGSYLGKMLVVSYLQNELPKNLHLQFQLEYPEIDRLYVLDKAYKQATPNRFFATFTHFIGKNQKDPFFVQFIGDAFTLFVTKYILKHTESTSLPVNFAGSIAFYFSEILCQVLQHEGVKIGKIVKSPMEGLVDYHVSSLKR